MEDQNTKPQTESPKPFSDIQPSQPQASDAPQAAALDIKSQTEPVEAPIDDTVDQANPATTEPEQAVPLIAATSPHAVDHKAPIGVIIVAVLIAAALASMAVLTYMKNDKKEAASSATPTTAQQNKQEVTADDVDTTNKDIDSSLGQTNDATDFDTNSLSDSSLSL